MHIFKLFPFLLLFSISTEAQRNCGSHDIFSELIQTNPQFREYQKKANKVISNERSSTAGIITIPVVIHVIYNTSAENISDDQIYSQMQVLNEDFRRLNSDRDNLWIQAADTEIEFCLATRDQYGDPTCGITRTHTDSTKFSLKTSMKSEATGGKTGWPADEYLNIWVCDLSGLLGFATFPGGPLNIDGVVTDTRAFGTIGDLKTDFALGRTTTHEIGHWLNLRHIWGDGDCAYDDFVSDTPLSDDHNYGCDPGHVSCGSVDMVQNYMDYSDDVCMNLFTIGQKNRMRAQFEPGEFRAALLESKGCEAPLNCNQLFISITFDDYPSDISWTLRSGGSTGPVILSGQNYPNASFANATIDESICVPDGINYSFTIYDSYGDGICCNEGNGSYEIYSTYQTLVQSNGNFGSGENRNFNLNDVRYRFVGPGSQWSDPANWNKLDPPSDCYDGEIIIENNCVWEGTYEKANPLTIKNNATLTIKNTP